MKKTLHLIPSNTRKALKAAYHSLLDLFEHDRLKPPRSLIASGSGDGDFRKIGLEFAKYFVEFAGLQPKHKVLDVGCGVGRMAVPLLDVLSSEGEYWGFDIGREGIDWCNRAISPRAPNFHFFHCDIANEHYNPTGKILAKDYIFPFEESTFDFVFLTSVFTHLLPESMEHYLSEISRVLKPMGRSLITFFVINAESKKLIDSGKSTLNIVHKQAGCLVLYPEDLEFAVGYAQEDIEALSAKYGLDIREPVHFGKWCGRTDYLSYQDIVVAQKR